MLYPRNWGRSPVAALHALRGKYETMIKGVGNVCTIVLAQYLEGRG